MFFDAHTVLFNIVASTILVCIMLNASSLSIWTLNHIFCRQNRKHKSGGGANTPFHQQYKNRYGTGTVTFTVANSPKAKIIEGLGIQ